MTKTTFENQHGRMDVYDSGAIHFMPYNENEDVIYVPTWVTHILTSNNGKIKIMGTQVYLVKDDTETLIPDFSSITFASITIKAEGGKKSLIIHSDGTIETERGIGYEVGLATTAAIYQRHAYIIPFTLSDGTVIDLDRYAFLEAIADVGYFPYPYSLAGNSVAFDIPLFSQIKTTAEIINRYPATGVFFEEGDVSFDDKGEIAIIYFPYIPWPKGHPPYCEFYEDKRNGKPSRDKTHQIATNLVKLLNQTSAGLGKTHAIIHGAANSERKIAVIARTGMEADLLVKRIKSVNPQSDVFPVTLRELGEMFDLNRAFNGVVPVFDHSVVEFLALCIQGYDVEFLLQSLCPFNDIAARRHVVSGRKAEVVILSSEDDAGEV